MLEVIEYMHLSASGLRSNDFLTLRHSSAPVNLSTMVDLGLDINPVLVG